MFALRKVALVIALAVGVVSVPLVGGSAPAIAQEDEIAFNYALLHNIMRAANFSDSRIAQALGEIQAVESELVDIAGDNRRLASRIEDYIEKFQAVSLIQIASESLYGVGPGPTNFDQWSGQVTSVILSGVNDTLNQAELDIVRDALSFLAQPGFWGKLDLVLGERESYIDYTVSGSDREGWAVPCLQQNCTHIELSSEIFPMLHGRRWIGGQQQVRGGRNPPLKYLNGGREPTGRLPFGDRIKIVVHSVNESQGTVQFAAYLNFCIQFLFYKSCSPYFIGPLPWLSAAEKDWVLVGFGASPPVNLPPVPDIGQLPSPGPVPAPQPTPVPTPMPMPTSTPASAACRPGLMLNPTPGYPVTSEFGMRDHPIFGFPTLHDGIDLGTPIGTPVRAACAGEVFIAEVRGGLGQYIAISHGNSITTGYAHLSEIHVSRGDRVEAGQVIGNTGNTGISTGPHLHFQTWVNGDPRNPRNFVTF